MAELRITNYELRIGNCGRRGDAGHHVTDHGERVGGRRSAVGGHFSTHRCIGHRLPATDQHLGLADVSAAGVAGGGLLRDSHRRLELAGGGSGDIRRAGAGGPVIAAVPALQRQLRLGLLLGLAVARLLYPRLELPARLRPVPVLHRHPSRPRVARLDDLMDRRGQAAHGTPRLAHHHGAGAVPVRLGHPAAARLLDRAYRPADHRRRRAARTAPGVAGGAAGGVGAHGGRYRPVAGGRDRRPRRRRRPHEHRVQVLLAGLADAQRGLRRGVRVGLAGHPRDETAADGVVGGAGPAGVRRRALPADGHPGQVEHPHEQGRAPHPRRRGFPGLCRVWRHRLRREPDHHLPRRRSGDHRLAAAQRAGHAGRHGSPRRQPLPLHRGANRHVHRAAQCHRLGLAPAAAASSRTGVGRHQPHRRCE